MNSKLVCRLHQPRHPVFKESTKRMRLRIDQAKFSSFPSPTVADLR
jgi:hypothetical protein